MKNYELLYILPPKHTDDEISVIADKIKEIAVGFGATITDLKVLGRRKLAYPINHMRHGVYVLVHFEAPTETVSKLNENLRLSTDVVRHMIIERSPHITTIPSFAEEEETKKQKDETPRRKSSRSVKKPSAPMTMEDLDKKLDQILTEENV